MSDMVNVLKSSKGEVGVGLDLKIRCASKI